MGKSSEALPQMGTVARVVLLKGSGGDGQALPLDKDKGKFTIGKYAKFVFCCRLVSHFLKQLADWTRGKEAIIKVIQPGVEKLQAELSIGKDNYVSPLPSMKSNNSALDYDRKFCHRSSFRTSRTRERRQWGILLCTSNNPNFLRWFWCRCCLTIFF